MIQCIHIIGKAEMFPGVLPNSPVSVHEQNAASEKEMPLRPGKRESEGRKRSESVSCGRLCRLVDALRLLLAAGGGSGHDDLGHALLARQIEHRLLQQLLADGA